MGSCVVTKPDSSETKEGLAALRSTNTTQSVLLIEKITGLYHGIYNKRRMNDCKQFYKGNVEAIKFSELDKDPKYADKNVYRYMLKDATTSREYSSMNNRTGAVRTNTHVITNYILVDRLTGKEIDLNVHSANPDKGFERAIKKIGAHMN